jgi:hypothetical protein
MRTRVVWPALVPIVCAMLFLREFVPAARRINTNTVYFRLAAVGCLG